MEKDYITNISANAERRFFSAPVVLETRDGQKPEESRTIFGYGIVFNSPSREMRTSTGQKFIEVIDPKSVEGLLDDEDTKSYFNHNADIVYARNKRTMQMGADAKGVWYRFEAPKTQAGDDLLFHVRSGNIDTSSFGFEKETDSIEKRSDGPWLRTITKIKKIWDMGPVSAEAYPETTVASRSFSNAEQEELEQKEKDKQVASRYLEIIKKQNQLRKLNMELAAA